MKTSHLSSLVFLCSTLVAAGATFIKNPSFEENFNPAFPGYSPIDQWTAIPGGNTGVNEAGGPFHDNSTIPDRARVALHQGSGGVKQTISGLQPGREHWLQFRYNKRNGGQMGLRTFFGGVEIDNIPSIPLAGTNAYHFRQVPFTPSVGTGELEFRTTATGDATALIDAVTIVARGPDQVLVQNPSFEASGVVGFPGYVGPAAISGWTSTGGFGVNVSGAGPFADNGVNPDQDSVAFIQGIGSLSQVISNLVVGQTYKISYSCNARAGNFPYLQVTMGGDLLNQETILEVGAGVPYLRRTNSWVATATAATLKFDQLETVGDNTLLLDDVQIEGIALIPIPPQKIFIAFGQPSSFSLIVPTVFGRAWPVVNAFGSIPAATVSDSYRNAVTTQIKGIFSRSGIHNLEWTVSDSDDAIAVFFCPTVNPDLLGYSKGLPDRFNTKRRGEVIIFVNETLPILDAESAAHEIGHALGLRHVDPPVTTDPSNEEVMDSEFSPSPEFISAVSKVTDITSFSTHNPRYHLLRYVDGWSPIDLHNAGINPGMWDNGSTINTRFSFQNENLRLYNITVFASGGSTESSFALEQISSATLAELSARSFSLPEGLGIVLLASSTTNGPPDVISSTGDAFNVTNQVISSSGTNVFSLFRQDSLTNAVAVSAATAEFDAQSPHCNIFTTAPGVLRLDFRGTLQTSTTLTDWTDFDAVSPHFIAVGLTNGVGFFRSRQ